VEDGGDGEVPRGVGGHDQAQEGPDPVVVKRRDEHRGGAAGAEDVGPRPLVQLVVDVVDVAAADIYDITYSVRIKLNTLRHSQRPKARRTELALGETTV
jgi:hypothetical protein